MRPPRRALLTLAALLLATSAHAQVYKCKVDGKTVFADQPCATDAKLIDVRPASGHSAPALPPLVITKYLLYLLRWQLSTPILWFILHWLGSGLWQTVVANLVGGCLFFFVDRVIFTRR